MTESMDAVFDGVSFRTTQPCALEPNTRVRITIETVEPCAPPPQSFLDVAQSLDLQGPSDWSENLESYLYSAEALPQ